MQHIVMPPHRYRFSSTAKLMILRGTCKLCGDFVDELPKTNCWNTIVERLGVVIWTSKRTFVHLIIQTAKY